MSLSTHRIGHITSDSFIARGNQYIELVKVLYCKLPTKASNYQLSHLRSGGDLNSDLRGESVTNLPLWPPPGIIKTFPGIQKSSEIIRTTTQTELIDYCRHFEI